MHFCIGGREEELIIEGVMLEECLRIQNSSDNLLFELCHALRSIFKAGCVPGTASPLKKEHCCLNDSSFKCF